MNAASQIFQTLDALQKGALDLFQSNPDVVEEPDQSYSRWHLRDAIPGNDVDFSHIKSLFLQDSSQLQSLVWLKNFPNLEKLWIYGAAKIFDLEGIQSARNLKALTIWPSMTATITLNSLSPLSSLTKLEEMVYSGRTRDGLLVHFHALQNLKTVFFSNSYSWEEIARFEANHPDVDFPWKGGIVPNANPSTLKCKKCTAPQSMLSGKGLKLSCPRCDAAYIEKHLQRYNKIASA